MDSSELVACIVFLGMLLTSYAVCRFLGYNP